MIYQMSSISTLYVTQKAPQGTFTLGCTPDITRDTQGPMPSLERAFDRIREMRRAGMRQPVTIRLLDDCYRVEQTIECPPDVENITIEAQRPGCTISGAVSLCDFSEIQYGGRRCLTAPVPEGMTPADLYVDGRRAERTRYPEEGYLLPEEVEVKSPELFCGSQWFIARREDVEKLGDVESMTVSFGHFWIDEHSPVAEYDRKTRKVTLKYCTRFSVYAQGLGTGWDEAHRMKYYFENVPEMSKSNQWFFDRKNSRIYYMPVSDSQTAENVHACVPTTKVLMRIHGKNVRLRGLTFAYTSGDYSSKIPGKRLPLPEFGYASDSQSVSGGYGVVEFDHASNCSAEACTFCHYGVHGVVLQPGCHGIEVLHCKFFDCGAGGIRVEGGSDPEQPEHFTYGNTLADNHITQCGRRFLAGCGILVMHSFENKLLHNTICDTYYSGISVGWVWGYAPSLTRDNRIEGNHIYNIGQERLSDMGGIYLLGRQQGTVIKNNLIHDVRSRDYGGWGIYLDEGTSSVTVENNISCRTSSNAFYEHYGEMNVVRNNIFFADSAPLLRLGRHELTTGVIITNNILCVKSQPLYQTGFDDKMPTTLAAHGNLIYDLDRCEPVLLEQDGKKYTLTQMQQTFGVELDSVIANPGLRAPKEMDFALSPDSPAYAMGFQPFDLGSAGCRS